MVKKISANEFNEVNGKKAALVDFSAAWCGPCRMLAPVLEEVSDEMDDKLSFYNVDVDENIELAQQFGISNIPALALIKNGKLADMLIGFRPKEEIENFIKSQL